MDEEEKKKGSTEGMRYPKEGHVQSRKPQMVTEKNLLIKRALEPSPAIALKDFDYITLPASQDSH